MTRDLQVQATDLRITQAMQRFVGVSCRLKLDGSDARILRVQMNKCNRAARGVEEVLDGVVWQRPFEQRVHRLALGVVRQGLFGQLRLRLRLAFGICRQKLQRSPSKLSS